MFLTSPLIEWRRSPVLIQHVSELRVETTWRALIDATKRKRIFPLTKILNSNFGCGFIFVWISNSKVRILVCRHNTTSNFFNSYVTSLPNSLNLPLAFQREVFQEIVRRTNIISFVTKFYLHLQST